jgi:hypothetical protein
MIKSMVTDKAVAHDKEQICVVLRQSGESVKGDTINGHEDR